MNLAPVVLFVYNRPIHTNRVLEALKKNHLADRSILYIYSDGSKKVNGEDHEKIEEVRRIIRKKSWCKEVIILESQKNLGIKKSIIEGVTEVINKHQKAIVLEDDILTSEGFLKYMNEALNLYEKDTEVMHVSGYIFPIKGPLSSTFFYNTASCWGWATWKRAWNLFDPNPRIWIGKFKRLDQIHEFNIEGTYDFYDHLVKNAEGQLNSWAVMWYCSIFFNKGFALHPYPSLVNNIGNDGSGINSISSHKFEWKELATEVPLHRIERVESEVVRQRMQAFHLKLEKQSHWLRTVGLMNRIFSKDLIEKLKSLRSKSLKRELDELGRIGKSPRFFPMATDILGKRLQIVDSASFLFMYNEIFRERAYDFRSSKQAPLIIDGGANIGLSCIFFKTQFPNARIIAFEPDPGIFEVLKLNIQSFELDQIQLINQALWEAETEFGFDSDKADGGKLVIDGPGAGSTKVKTTILSKFLNRQDGEIDLLKLDIEGAETEVLREASEYLGKVNNIFIEYHSFISRDQNLDELIRILSDSGFRYFISSPGLHSKNPFLKVDKYLGMDMQLNIYGIRE